MKNLLDKVKKNKFLLFILTELIIVIIYATNVILCEKTDIVWNNDNIKIIHDNDAIENNVINESEGEYRFETDVISINSGIYEITVDYDAEEDDNTVKVSANTKNPNGILQDTIYLKNYDKTITYNVWVKERAQNFKVIINYANSGEMAVNNVKIKTAWNSNLYKISKMILILMISNIIVLYLLKRKKGLTDDFVVIFILAVVFVSSAVSFTGYAKMGHDLFFHLLRIEGLKDALLAGQLPARIQPNWCNGWGYPVSIMYGDLVIIIPAILRILGFPVQTSYNIFIFIINLSTAYVAYYTFKKISKDKYVALTLSAVYTLSVYRLADIYVRAAIGEYSAMIFLPLIVLGFYYLFSEKDNKDGSVYLIIGLSGIIQTHILTCLMIAIFFFLFILADIRKIFNKKIIINLLLTGVWTILINLWFIVPFLQYMKQPLAILNEEYIGNIQQRGVTFAEIFAPIFNGAMKYHWDSLESIGMKPSLGVGSSLLIILFIYFVTENKISFDKVLKKNINILFVLSVLALFMGTNIFPYDFIDAYMPLVTRVISKVKLPYRYFSMSVLLITFMASLFLVKFKQYSKRLYRYILMFLTIITFYQASQYVYTSLYSNGMYLCYDEKNIYSGNVVGGEYLYSGSKVEDTFTDNTYYCENTNVNKYIKNDKIIKFDIKDAKDGAFVSVSRFYYPGYVAKDKYGNKLVLSRDENSNNRIKVNIPKGYEGGVIIYFKKPIIWMVCEIISILAVFALAWRRTERNRI